MHFLFGFLTAWLVIDVVLALADSFPFHKSGVALARGWGLYIVMFPFMLFLPLLWIIGRTRVLIWRMRHRRKT